MKRICSTHPSGNSTKQSFESESHAHLSTADLVCATSQQHFRGQETALRTEGDSDKHSRFQADGRQNYNILAAGKQGTEPLTHGQWHRSHCAGAVPWVSLCWGRYRPSLGTTDPPHTAAARAAGEGVLHCSRGAALCLWLANLGGFLSPLHLVWVLHC